MEEREFIILYVDDELYNLESFKLAFLFHDTFKIVTAQSGEEALTILNQQKKIDLIISDMRMPGIDGLTFIKKVKKNINVTIPCIILSGYEISPETLDALKLGIVDKYIMKPFELDDLEESLKNILMKPV